MNFVASLHCSYFLYILRKVENLPAVWVNSQVRVSLLSLFSRHSYPKTWPLAEKNLYLHLEFEDIPWPWVNSSNTFKRFHSIARISHNQFFLFETLFLIQNFNSLLGKMCQAGSYSKGSKENFLGARTTNKSFLDQKLEKIKYRRKTSTLKPSSLKFSYWGQVKLNSVKKFFETLTILISNRKI